jgi:acyl-CoA synthetase (AMP-forming)/AMP-acid ligase II
VLRVACGLRNKLQLKPAPFTPGPRQNAIISPVILLHLPNCIQQPVLKLGIWAAGLTVTTINSALKPAEVAYIVNNSKPAAIITLASVGGLDVILDSLKDIEDKALVERYRSGNIFTVDLESDEYGLHIPSRPKRIDSRGAKVRDWKWLLDSSAEGQSFPKYATGESQRRAALILWSSGTSGKSKGVILSHQALAASVLIVLDAAFR